MWPYVRKALRGLDPVRVENSANLGTPDVNYTAGWVELKYISEWPKRPETVVRADHFTPQQRTWLTRRVRSGGRAFMLLRVGVDWLLFRGDVAATIVGQHPKKTLFATALRTWSGRLDPKDLRECLTT